MKKSKVILVSMILGIAYTLYLVSYFSSINAQSTTEAEAIGTGLATLIILPHLGLVGLATIFNIIAFAKSKKWATITALVLYSVAGLLFLPYLFFVIPMIVLSAVGIKDLKKINEEKGV